MKHVRSQLPAVFVFAAALLYILSMVHAVPTVTAAPSGPNAPMMSSPNYAIAWSAAGEISGGSSASTHYKLNSTIEQLAANTSSLSTHYDLCTGFQCVPNKLSVYLPLALKNF